MQATATFHAATLGRELPDWVDRGDNWREVGVAYWREAVGLWATAALAKPRDDEALHWLEQAAQRFAALEARSDTHRQVLLHRDIRSDNLRWRQSHLYLLDWPAVMPGNPEEDLAAFAQSITLEGGPPPEQLVAWYAERLPVAGAVLDAALAAVCGYFATNAPKPELPLLPRLRIFQRAQLRVTLAWAAGRLSLPDPGWLTALA